MGDHINADGRFQSDKYPTCPAGKVPLSTRDRTAQDLLWDYSQRRRAIDFEFSEDLEICLKKDGFVPTDLRNIRLSNEALEAIRGALDAHIVEARKTMGQLMGHQHGMAQALAGMIMADNAALEQLNAETGAQKEP